MLAETVIGHWKLVIGNWSLGTARLPDNQPRSSTLL
jgi:hypothetical protein